MKKKQWLLIAAAISLVIFLFSLPKIVIDNDANEVEGIVDESLPDSSSQNSEFNAHSLSADTSLNDRIEGLKSDYQLAENKKKKSIFADSLAKAFAQLRDFDNAIMFGKEALEASPSAIYKESLADIEQGGWR